MFIWILRNGRKLNLEENVVKKNEKGNKCDFVIVPEIITVICTSYSDGDTLHSCSLGSLLGIECTYIFICKKFETNILQWEKCMF